SIATGAERRPHRDLAPSGGTAGEREIGDVRAGDEENEHHRRGKHLERTLEIAHQILAHRDYLRAPTLVVHWDVVLQTLHDHIEVALRRVHAHAGLEPSDGASVPTVSALVSGLRNEWRPRLTTLWECEAARHHADHRVRLQ